MLGEKVRIYTDFWGARGIYCAPCAQMFHEENGGLSIVFPAYTEIECEQCGEREEG